MRRRSLRPWQVVCLSLWAFNYGCGYAAARATHHLVHGRSFLSDGFGHLETTRHDVRCGDLGWTPLPELCRLIFAPLCWLEVAVWYRLDPVEKTFGPP